MSDSPPVADRLRRASGAFAGPGSKLSLAAVVSVVISGSGTVVRYALQVFLAQVLGAAGFGLYLTLRRWSETVATLPNLGYRGAVVRFLPGYEGDRRWASYLGIIRYSLLLTLGIGSVLAVLASAIGWFNWPDHHLAALAAMIAIPAWAVFRMADGILVAQHRYLAASAVDQLAQPAIMGLAVLVYWLVADSIDVGEIMIALLGSIAVAIAVDLRLIQRHLPTEARVWRAEPGAEISSDTGLWQPVAWQFYFHQLSSAVIGSADILILAMFVSLADVGIYGAASRIALLARVVNSGTDSIVAPRISAAWAAGNPVGLQRNVDKAIAVTAPPTIALVMLLAWFSRPLLRLMGAEFVDGAGVMFILLVGIAVQALTGPCGNVVALTGNERFNARTMMVAAVALVVACFVAAPLAGAIGVAIAVSAVNVGWNAVLTVFARRRIGIRTYPYPGMVRSLAVPDWARRGGRG